MLGKDMVGYIILVLEQFFGELNECVLVIKLDWMIIFVNKVMEVFFKILWIGLIGIMMECFFVDLDKFV